MKSQSRIPNKIIERFKKIDSATVYSGVFKLGLQGSQFPAGLHEQASWQNCFIKGVKSMTPGKKLVARAVTLRCVPPRPDLLEFTRKGEFSPEYEAMGSCGPGDVLVIDGMRDKGYSILGNIKTRHLYIQNAEGLVTDSAIRDIDKISKDYDLSVFAGDRVATANRPAIEPYEANVPIGCGGALVMPGDLIVADDDGVVVVPNQLVEEIIDWAEEHEKVEEFIMKLIDQENAPPGRYYPISEETIKKFRKSSE
tara:strand:- start:1716 stop:2474 length:759 start_codon:yes stop_codon:yes gene_type:complete